MDTHHRADDGAQQALPMEIKHGSKFRASEQLVMVSELCGSWQRERCASAVRMLDHNQTERQLRYDIVEQALEDPLDPDCRGVGSPGQAGPAGGGPPDRRGMGVFISQIRGLPL